MLIIIAKFYIVNNYCNFYLIYFNYRHSSLFHSFVLRYFFTTFAATILIIYDNKQKNCRIGYGHFYINRFVCWFGRCEW